MRFAALTPSPIAHWLRSTSRPFFLYVHATDPHAPYLPPARFRRGVRAVDGVTPAAVIAAERRCQNCLHDLGRQRPAPIDASTVAVLSRLYDGDVARADAAFGRLVDVLVRQRLLDDTLVIFTSDHGEEFLEHDGVTHGKTLYHELLHVLTRPYCNLPPHYRFVSGKCTLVVTGVLDAFTVTLKLSLYAGLILSSPVWLWQLWRFITPGLHRHERRYAVVFVASSVALFACGAIVAYLTLAKGLRFLLGFATGGIAPLLTLLIAEFGFAAAVDIVVASMLAVLVPVAFGLLRSKRADEHDQADAVSSAGQEHASAGPSDAVSPLRLATVIRSSAFIATPISTRRTGSLMRRMLNSTMVPLNILPTSASQGYKAQSTAI